MAIQEINIGSGPNTGTGEPIRDAFDKVNSNFTEVSQNLSSLGLDSSMALKQIGKVANPDWVVQNPVNTTTVQPDHHLNYAYPVAQAGTIWGLTVVIGDWIVDNGAAFSVKKSNDKLVTIESDLNQIQPVVHYVHRVTSDMGVINSKKKTVQIFQEALDILSSAKFMWDGYAGTKHRISGINTFATKIYSMDGSDNDAVQATEANQPYLGGLIAPNESPKLKKDKGSDPYLEFTPISIAANGSASITIMAETEDNGDEPYLKMGKYGLWIKITSDYITIYLTPAVSGSITRKKIGANCPITIIYKNGNIALYEDGEYSDSILLTPTYIEISYLLKMLYSNTSNTTRHQSIFNRALSAQEIQSLHTYLRQIHPEVETCTIGSKAIATSNYEGTVDADGVVIPEVQSASTAVAPEIITDAADRGFTSDTGYWNKNGTNTVITGGALVITNADTGANGINRIPMLIVGKAYSLTYTINSITSGGVYARLGSTLLSTRTLAGTYTEAGIASGDGGLRLYGNTVGQSFEIDNISVKEIGWSDLTTPAWCHYNNDPALGAVYGKLYNGYCTALKAPRGTHFMTETDALEIIEELGGSTVAGGKMKAKWGGFDNDLATNESGMSLLSCGIRLVNGEFSSDGSLSALWVSDKITYVRSGANSIVSPTSTDIHEGYSLRLVLDEPYGQDIDQRSGTVTGDFASSAKVIFIPHGYRVDSCRMKTTASLTNITAKLYDFNNNEKETLFTGVSLNNGETVIPITIAQTVLRNKGSVRFTAIGNTGYTTEIYVELSKVVKS